MIDFKQLPDISNEVYKAMECLIESVIALYPYYGYADIENEAIAFLDTWLRMQRERGLFLYYWRPEGRAKYSQEEAVS